MRKNYDWVDRTIFLMFAYAHITDWELADSERSLIQSKIDFVLKKIQGDSYQYEPEIIANKMSTVYKYWSDVQEESFDEVLTELQDIASEIKKQDWFDSIFAQKIIDFLAEIAKVDGIVLDNEKFSLDDLSNLWEVESRL
tara:strand:- start:1349 stop:1768 length:420 start_codon:yes stop_codon:yes gene_type:complete